jgi:hypothetical protein
MTKTISSRTHPRAPDEARHGGCLREQQVHETHLEFLERRMIGLAILLLMLWILGGFVFKVAGGAIHLLLVLAAVVLIYRFVRRPRSTV